MNDETEARAEVVATLAEYFNRDLTKLAYEAYLAAMVDVPLEEFRAAAMRAMREREFFPVASVLRELCGRSGASIQDEALIAWEQVQQATRHGAYKSIDFEDKAINAALRALGGWPELLGRTPEEFDKWVRQDFLKTYTAFRRSGVSDEAGRALPGLSDSGPVKNTRGKVHYTEASPPVFISDRSSASETPRLEKG